MMTVDALAVRALRAAFIEPSPLESEDWHPTHPMTDPFQIAYSHDSADEFYTTLDREGFCCVKDAISSETLEKFRQEVKGLVNANGRRFLFLVNPYKYPGSAFRSLALSTNFKKFLLHLSNRESKQDNSDFELLNVLRVVPGDRAVGQTLNFHFDAEVITALVPIDIPKGPPDRSGNLVAIPNLRPIRKFVFVNFLDKLIFQNSIARKLIAHFTLRNGSQKHIYQLIPGNIYFFWGYRTLHANLPLEPSLTRATMLFHFGNPHKNSAIVKFIKSRHRQVDAGVNS